MKLEDLKIIVTGGASGMGAHFATRLHQAGAKVAVGDVNSEGLERLPDGIFTRKLDVCTTTPEDWEETGVDISSFVGEVNRLKRQLPALGREGRLVALTSMDSATLVLRKTAATKAGSARLFVVINKDWQRPQPCTLPPELLEEAPGRLHRICRGAEAVPRPKDDLLNLDPAEVVLLY